MTQLAISNGTIWVLNRSYNYPAGANDGKIGSQADNVSGEVAQYTYDSLNRLVTATSNQNWGETYTYDGFGNLTGKTPTGTAPALSIYVDPMTNRGGGSFDANGNQTQITIGGQPYKALYDIENRMASIGVFWGPSMAYAYDPQNRRVWSWDPAQQDSYGNPTSATVYFYGVDGSRLGAYGWGLILRR